MKKCMLNFGGDLKVRDHLKYNSRRLTDNIKTDLREMLVEGVACINLAQERGKLGTVIDRGYIKFG
jgi:hypothetical protein